MPEHQPRPSGPNRILMEYYVFWIDCDQIRKKSLIVAESYIVAMDIAKFLMDQYSGSGFSVVECTSGTS